MNITPADRIVKGFFHACASFYGIVAQGIGTKTLLKLLNPTHDHFNDFDKNINDPQNNRNLAYEKHLPITVKTNFKDKIALWSLVIGIFDMLRDWLNSIPWKVTYLV